MKIKNLKHYLAENAEIHEFRLKLAVEPLDEQLDALETYLRKYDVFDVETPRKTIMQRNPRDFRSIDAAEIWIIDFKTRLAASPHMMLAELSQAMGIHERAMVLRNKLEPHNIEDELEEIGDEPEEYSPRLLDPDYTEVENPVADEYYGEEFKMNFLQELENERKGNEQ